MSEHIEVVLVIKSKRELRTYEIAKKDGKIAILQSCEITKTVRVETWNHFLTIEQAAFVATALASDSQH